MCFFPSDILLSIATFLTFLNVFVKKFVVYFMFPQESVVDHPRYSRTCCRWQREGSHTLSFLHSTLENPEALQSFLPILCQFHLWVKNSDGFTCSISILFLTCSTLQYSSDTMYMCGIKRMIVGHEGLVTSCRSGLQRIGMLIRCSAYSSLFNKLVAYWGILCSVLYCIVWMWFWLLTLPAHTRQHVLLGKFLQIPGNWRE